MRLIDKDKLLEKLAELIAVGTLNTFEELGDIIEDMPEADPFEVAIREYFRKDMERVDENISRNRD